METTTSGKLYALRRLVAAFGAGQITLDDLWATLERMVALDELLAALEALQAETAEVDLLAALEEGVQEASPSDWLKALCQPRATRCVYRGEQAKELG